MRGTFLTLQVPVQDDLRPVDESLWAEARPTSRLQGLLDRANFSALCENGFHVKVADIGNMCRARRNASED